MRVLLVADGRSPITRRLLRVLNDLALTVGLVSTFPCDAPEGLDFFTMIPVAFSQWAGSSAGSAGQSSTAGSRSGLRRMVGRSRSIFLAGRYTFGPLSVRAAAGPFQRAVAAFQPDLVHALRIPFEGMLAAHTPRDLPLLVSIWGNDLTLHARGSPWMRSLTLACLRRADGLLADAKRDLRLGRLWGLRPDAPVLAVPGSGGIHLSEIQTHTAGIAGLFAEPLPPDAQIVINPRGFRPGSVRNDTFFAAAAGLLHQAPRAVLVCPAMAGQVAAVRWLEEMRAAGLAERVRLLPTLPQARLWDLFHCSQVFVSPSAHDGTPNSLLEAMACGVFPVAGDIESIREWLTPGVNGLLVDPSNPGDLSSAILLALNHPDLRARAAARNQDLIARRASVDVVREKIAGFYHLFGKNLER